MTVIMLFGDSKAVELAQRMIEEAVDNKEAKAKARAKEYERKRDQKRRDRQIYHLRWGGWAGGAGQWQRRVLGGAGEDREGDGVLLQPFDGARGLQLRLGVRYRDYLFIVTSAIIATRALQGPSWCCIWSIACATHCMALRTALTAGMHLPAAQPVPCAPQPVRTTDPCTPPPPPDRHTHDYEALELPIGASKADVKKAYKALARKWHPDKHPEDPDSAKAKFQEIQKAYDSLMSTDEDQHVEQIEGKAS
jgi:hypothetical protein